MSRTDKDVPYRVHVAREGVERHDHRFGFCDWEPSDRSQERYRLDQRGWRYREPCGLDQPIARYSYTLRYFPRTRLQQFYSGAYYDRDSSRLRRELTDIKKLHRAGEDIEFEDVWNRQHRHSAEWEAW